MASVHIQAPPTGEATGTVLLPKGWRMASLEEVCERPQYGYTASADSEANGPKFLRITDITDDGVDWASVPNCKIDKTQEMKYQVKDGDILVARIGATTGKSFLISKSPRAIFASYLIRIRTGPALLPEFLALYMQSSAYWSYVSITKGGRLKQGVNIPVLRELRVPLPPVTEQRAIVGVLSAIKEARQSTRRVIVATRELKRSFLRQVFEPGPVALPNAASSLLRDVDHGSSLRNWQTTNLGSVVRSYKNGIYKPVRFYGTGYPSVRMFNIVDGHVNLQDSPKLEVTDEELEAFGLQEHDVLINRVNSGDLVGKAGLVPGGLGPVTFESKNIRVRLDENKVVPGFFVLWTLTPQYVSQIRQMVRAAVGQATINQGDLDRIEFPLPPVGEQRRIIAALEAIESKVSAEEGRYRALEEVFKGLLSGLLTGKLAISQPEVGANA